MVGRFGLTSLREKDEVNSAVLQQVLSCRRQCALIPMAVIKYETASVSREMMRTYGRIPWDAVLLWRYLLMRSETCKPSSISSCLSALASCSLRYQQVLPTQKWDGPALLRKQIVNMKREIVIRYNVGRDKDVDVQKSTPLGQQDMELMLSALQTFGERDFNLLSRRSRHELNASAMQHACAMRFGHFLYRAYAVSMLLWGADGAARLVTD